MKNPRFLIFAFVIFAILANLGYFIELPALANLSTIALAALGSIVTIIFEAMDTQGQGFKLWLQSKKYRNKDIRLSMSYLYRIQVDSKYLMVKGNRLQQQYQPVGGVYKYYQEAKPILEKFKFHPDTKMDNFEDGDDLRIYIKGKYILSFIGWFQSMENREYDPTREFREELIKPGLLPAELFKKLEYRKIFVHNEGIQHSKYLTCDELLYADIFELKLTPEQEEAIRKAVNEHHDTLCLVSSDEIKTLCYNGIEKNLGTNAPWILGG